MFRNQLADTEHKKLSVKFHPSLDIGNICLNLLIIGSFLEEFSGSWWLSERIFKVKFSAERSLLGYEE
jgi:hypothetical protein